MPVCSSGMLLKSPWVAIEKSPDIDECRFGDANMAFLRSRHGSGLCAPCHDTVHR